MLRIVKIKLGVKDKVLGSIREQDTKKAFKTCNKLQKTSTGEIVVRNEKGDEVYYIAKFML